MKLKFYLRGLGIGIFVTALVMTIASSNKGTMTDEEIMQRATELGMVTQKTLISQAQEEGTLEAEDSVKATENPTEAPTVVPVATDTPTQMPASETQASDSKTEPPEAEKTPGPTPEPTEAPTVVPESRTEEGQEFTLTIVKGEHSVNVSKKLENLGLIEDYADFDDYLCNNGYSRKINAGVYKLEPELSYEELAKIITRTN